MTILYKYLHYLNVFSKLLIELILKYIEINKYIIILNKNKQPPYESIYNFNLIELEI